MLRDSGLESVEQEVHVALTPWINSFSERSGEQFTDVSYDPVAYPEQRLDEPYMPPRQYPRWVPNRLMLHGLKKAVAEHVGSNEKLDSAIDTLQSTPAYLGSDRSVAQELTRRVDSNEAVGILVDHTEQGDLRDIALAMGILVLATEHSRYREHAAVLVGLNMSRQAYKGKLVGREVTKAVGVIWVMQNSENRRALPIPEKGIRIVNLGASRAIKDLRQKGLMLGIVPSGTAMRLARNERGEPELVRPDIEPASFGVMASLDALLPISIHKGSILPGSLYDLRSDDAAVKASREQRLAVVDAALDSLARNNAQLTGLPIRFRDSKEHSEVVNP